VKETPPVATEQVKTEPTQTPSGEVVKETPKGVSTDRVPYPRFSEVIGQKNEAIKRAEAAETRLREYESRQKPMLEETDPFASLSPEEREQTEKFIDKFVRPKILNDLKPLIQEVQNEKLNKQIIEAKDFSNKVGIKFDERLPEIVDFLSRPENKGRLTAKEALLSLYGDEVLENTRLKGKEEASQETKELIEKKKLANSQLSNVNQNVVFQSDEMAKKMMSPQERLSHDVRKAMELAKQGVRNPKVRIE
jgi:hypothetical protein